VSREGGSFDPGAVWDGDALVSARFGDVYASRAGALAQSRAVFLDGCGLPDRWAGRRRFTVAELGFGTGLNMLAVLEAWAARRAPGARLQLFSVEGFPLREEDAAQALAAHGELAGLSERLLAQWPQGARGVHRIDFPELGAVLDLVAVAAAESPGNQVSGVGEGEWATYLALGSRACCFAAVALLDVHL